MGELSGVLKTVHSTAEFFGRHVSCMFTRVWCNTEITTTIPDLERDCTWARKNTRELHRITTIVVMENNEGNIKGRKRLD